MCLYVIISDYKTQKILSGIS